LGGEGLFLVRQAWREARERRVPDYGGQACDLEVEVLCGP
jgi:hypothetical protein